MFYRCRGFQHNDIQLKNTQLDVLKYNTEHKWFKHFCLLNAAFFNVIMCVVLLISVSKLERKNSMKKFTCFIGAVPFSIMTLSLTTFSIKTLSLTFLNAILSTNELSIIVCSKFHFLMLCCVSFTEYHIFIVMLCVAMVNVVMLIVRAPFWKNYKNVFLHIIFPFFMSKVMSRAEQCSLK